MFDNSYSKLPSRFYERIAPEKSVSPSLIRVNEALAYDFGLIAVRKVKQIDTIHPHHPSESWKLYQVQEVGSSGQARRKGLDPRFREDDASGMEGLRR